MQSNVLNEVFRRQSSLSTVQSSSLFMEQYGAKAAQLVPKLKILYQANMAAFLHHLNKRHMESRHEIAMSLGHQRIEPVGLP